jgi:hypothetical protein
MAIIKGTLSEKDIAKALFPGIYAHVKSELKQTITTLVEKRVQEALEGYFKAKDLVVNRHVDHLTDTAYYVIEFKFKTKEDPFL